MVERITQIMKREGLTPSKFAETIGIQRAAMSHILNGRNNVSLDVLMKILKRFTYIDSDWLLFGKGEMERGQIPVQADLFSSMPLSPVEKTVPPENHQETKSETFVNSPKTPVVETIIQKEIQAKKINKIMVFYSDDTFETFISEKGRKG